MRRSVTLSASLLKAGGSAVALRPASIVIAATWQIQAHKKDVPQSIPTFVLFPSCATLQRAPRRAGVRSSFFGAVPNKAEGNIVSFDLADIGEGISEVEVLQWFIKEGDVIKAFDRICEVQSDKATVEISSRYDGKVVKIYHAIGDMAYVGKPLIDIHTQTTRPNSASATKSKGKESQEAPMASASTPEIPKTARPDSLEEMQQECASGKTKSLSSPSSPSLPPGLAHGLEGKVQAVPSVRALVKQHGLDISQICGSGRDGRVQKSDVMEYLEEHRFEDLSIETPMPSLPPASPAAVTQEAVEQEAGQYSAPVAGARHVRGISEQDRTEPVRGYMRTMIKTMQIQALVPHMGLSDEYDVGEAVQLREKLRIAAEARGIKLTHLPIFVKALSTALRDFPDINARLSDDLQNIEYRASHNVGIAIETQQGLVVPNIKNVQNLSLLEIAQEISRLSELAKAAKLSAEDLSGGTITLSNIGAIGGTYAAPILMPRESVIAALGSIQRLPRYSEHGALQQAKIMTVSWSADHRLLQGSVLARFSNRVKEILKDPSLMMLDMR